MSEVVSALPGARFDGIALVEEAGPVGMITIRGRLSDKGFAKGLKKNSVVWPRRGNAKWCRVAARR